MINKSIRKVAAVIVGISPSMPKFQAIELAEKLVKQYQNAGYQDYEARAILDASEPYRIGGRACW